MDLTGWRQPYPLAIAGSSRGSMEDESPNTDSPHQDKCRRLSLLLDKLAVQINNNNNYPTPQWLLVQSPEVEVKPPPQDNDKPLDLTVKSPISHRFLCKYCGQYFAGQGQLTKHIASRHRTKTDTLRSYECQTCMRKFARSDMLTRHVRLHTGIKPYCCSTCGQVFSRSDHLATHHRTHTGEKPYRCPNCPYAACRRDMITRHMRTHNRRAQPV